MSTDQITHTDLPTLRSVGIPTEPLRVVPPLTTVSPRPAAPARPLTARPVSHDLPDYEVATTPKTAAEAKPAAEYAPPGPLLGRDLYDAHHADQAFGAA